MSMDSSCWHWCTLSLQDILNFSGTWLGLLYPDYPVRFQPFIDLSLMSMSREINYSAMGCKLLYTVDLWRWTCNLETVDIFPQFWFSSPQTVLFSSFCSSCLVWHTQTHNAKIESTSLLFIWFQVWFLYAPHLLPSTGEFKWASHAWNKFTNFLDLFLYQMKST